MDDPEARPARDVDALPRNDDDEERKETTQVQVQEAVSLKFDKQARDSGWGRDTEYGLRVSIEAQLPKDSKVLDIECRETMCRIDMEHASRDKMVDVFEELVLGHARIWDGPTINFELRKGPNGVSISRSFFGEPSMSAL